MVEIEQMLHDNPHKRLLIRALELKHGSRLDSLADLFVTEVLLTGKQIIACRINNEIYNICLWGLLSLQ